MTTQYPLQFLSETTAHSGTQSDWKTKSEFQESVITIPPEFHGPGGGLSPEDLFNQALTNCFVATFKVYAENSKLTFNNIVVNSKLNVDLDANGKPVMKDFYLHAKIFSPSNKEKSLLLAKKASQAGFILNSVKTNCHFEFEIL